MCRLLLLVGLRIVHDKRACLRLVFIDLAWHTHMLHPKNYRKFTLKHLKVILSHDDNIAPEDISLYIEKFELAKRYFQKEEGVATKNRKSIFQIAFGTSSQLAADKKGGSVLGNEYWNGTLTIANGALDQSLYVVFMIVHYYETHVI